ncbi:MAG: DNA polymerase IV [Reyranellaceae bacterium]
MEATILHADLDAFYASVEQLLDPSLRGKPVAVGGGVVLAASYEAKAFGVRSAMPGRRARELCPELIFVDGHFKDYQRLGDAAVAVLGDFTPLVERLSIDEAFADVKGCTHLFGSPAEIARKVRHRVRSELGLPISVGVARTKHLAKIASQVAKPDGLAVVDPERELEFLHDLPVELMWGVGPVTQARLAEIGVQTIGQLARMPGRSLTRLLGPAAGEKLSALAWNRDPREIVTHRRSRSAGAQSALGRKPAKPHVIQPTLAHLADRIGARLRAKSLAGRAVTVRVRFADLHAVTRSTTLGAAISATASLCEIAEELVGVALADHPEETHISLLAISVSHLEKDPRLQLELPLGLANEARRPGTRRGLARRAADRAMDVIRDRFGRNAIGYGSVALGVQRAVPDAFRKLAERDL